MNKTCVWSDFHSLRPKLENLISTNEQLTVFTFGNTQPLLFFCEAAEGGFQSLGHHLFTSWSQKGDVSTLWICKTQYIKYAFIWKSDAQTT